LRPHDLSVTGAQDLVPRQTAGHPLSSLWDEFPVLRDALARAPEPERATRLAERVLATVDPTALRTLANEAPAGLARALRACCGVAPFLGPWLSRHPDWLLALARDDLREPLAGDPLRAELCAALDAAPDAEASRILRETKYRCFVRIVTRDCDEERVPLGRSGETLAELSVLAELLLDAALRIARARVTARLGPPIWRDARGTERTAGFCVLGLGKLGGEELNFSSDVDLVYVHEAVADGSSGPQTLVPADYWARVSREFGGLVAAETEHRFLYRVDLDLRPEGAQGPAVLSDEALAGYFEIAADHWEKVAFMKARPVAGDFELGWQAVRTVAPMIYQASMDYAGVQRIRSLKDRIGAERGTRGDGFDVKLDPGGIRDVEFTAQALQLLHGGRIPQLRDRSTQRTIERLAEVKLLPDTDAGRLLDSYRFLRRIENRLQMEEEHQVHRLPRRPDALRRLAIACGFGGDDAADRFAADLESQRACVRAFVARVRTEGGSSEEILQLFLRHQPGLVGSTATRPMMESLAQTFALEIAASTDPALAMNNLDRFIVGVAGRRFYYELLLDRPELVGRLAALFAGSRWLSATLARHPQLIEPLFADPELLLLDHEQLRTDLAALRAERAGRGATDYECELDALRLFVHRQIMNVGLLDIDQKVSRVEAETALSAIAEVALEAALEIARREVERVRPPSAGAAAARFLVVGMGKLASHELSYGSDLDLIFVYDLPTANDEAALEAQEHCVRVAQRLISALETPTVQGSCYEIDSRLRPSGNQGALVTSLAALRAYHAGEAQIWERQALLRARPIVGDSDAAAGFEELRRAALQRPLPPDAAAEIHHIRLRMESELTDETRGHRDLKRGRGGLLDVENAVQYLQLRHAAEAPDLLAVERTETTLDRLTEHGFLASESAASLREGWDFLQRLASRLRIVENRSISDVDAGSSELDAVACRLGYAAGAREASARAALLRDYHRHTEAIRSAYLAILGVG
jgi:glutamate-ammonia-ligase adenylyltransferase